MALDINNTYVLLQALEQSYPPQTLFRDTFFPNEQTFPTKTVLMDYRKGGRRLAPFVSRKGGSVNVNRDGFSTKEYEPPMTAPSRVITVDDASKRGFGETVFSMKTPQQRALELRASDMAEMADMNTRRMEWMCAQLMTYGKITVNGMSEDGKTVLSDTVTYPDWTQKLTLSGTDMWTDTSADIWGNLQTMSQTVARNSGRVPEIGIGSYATISKLLTNKSLKEYLSVPNQQNLSLMSIQPKIITPGITRFGYIQALNMEIYAYDGVYEDDAGTLQQYIPDGYFIAGVQGRGSQLFGAVTQLEQDNQMRTYEGKNVPKVWSDINNDVQKIRVASKGVPKPEFIDDWYTLKAF